MLNNVSSTWAAQFPDLARQIENRSRIEFKNVTRIISDKIEISNEARAALNAPPEVDEEPDDPIDKAPFEYVNTGGVARANENDDTAATEARRKLVAMKIAMRISKGDIVPMKDHRFLAEFDSALYKAALQASLVAENDDPKRHDSLVDEMLAEEQAALDPEIQGSETDADSAAVDADLDQPDGAPDNIPDSVDIYY